MYSCRTLYENVNFRMFCMLACLPLICITVGICAMYVFLQVVKCFEFLKALYKLPVIIIMYVLWGKVAHTIFPPSTGWILAFQLRNANKQTNNIIQIYNGLGCTFTHQALTFQVSCQFFVLCFECLLSWGIALQNELLCFKYDKNTSQSVMKNILKKIKTPSPIQKERKKQQHQQQQKQKQDKCAAYFHPNWEYLTFITF